LADPLKEIDDLVEKIAVDRDCDVLAYFGDIDRAGADRVLKAMRRRSARKNVILMLATFGGDANAAYRIARAIQNKYSTARKQIKTKADPRFCVFVPTYCKSAGTILALGADEIIMSREAELGPIDVQLRKQDEIGELTSGLTPNQAMRSLTAHSQALFKAVFSTLRFDSDLGFSTKMASEIAANLTAGLLNPVFAQLDPLRLAETERMLEISVQYGRRLALSNLIDPEDSLAKLVNSYPSHAFVIDASEAKEIFKNVSEPDVDLVRLANLFEVIWSRSLSRDAAFVYYLNEDTPPKDQSNDGKAEHVQLSEGTPSSEGGQPHEQSPARQKRSGRRNGPNPGKDSEAAQPGSEG
jgi:hypothetical protein